MTAPMRPRRQGALAAALLALSALILAGPASAAGSPAHGPAFNGFRPKFNLGQAANGAVCEARRNFDGPVVDSGGRVWDVSCRGWSNTLGQLYLFPTSSAGRAQAAWAAQLGRRTDCDPSRPGQPCRTRAAGLAYVVYRGDRPGGIVAAEGRAPIMDVLQKGLAYLKGDIPEPPAIDKATAAVSQVSTAPISQLGALDGAPARSAESLRRSAYLLGQAWQFGQAELDFSELSIEGSEASPTIAAEALYNQGLNASNNGRYDKAALFFDQADRLAASGDPSLRGLGLNYRAADARNQEDYVGAIRLADEAMNIRKALPVGGERTADGGVAIPEVGSADGTERISRADRERLRDVQALEIKATALEAMGKPDQAREALLAAVAILDVRLPVNVSVRKVITLGQAAPWLNTRVWGDLLRLDRGTPRQNDTEARFRAAVAFFAVRHPGSLPLAAFFLEQARTEAELADKDKTYEAKAVDDYKAAFTIFIDQRGSLADSADLARPYFDFLLKRIGDAPAAHPDDVKAFFTAAQALIAQSSAEAAKRQAAVAQAGDDQTAALARALQDTDRRQEANEAAIRKLNEQGVFRGPDIAALEARRQDLAAQNAKIQGQLLEVDPGFTSALRTLVDLDKLQKSLRPDEAYVKVFLLAGGGYGMLVTPTQAIPYRIALDRSQAQEMVDTLRLPIDSPGRTKTGRATHGAFNVALAHELFEDLFGPVRQPVLAARHIVYEPDATLIAAPISALVIDDASVTLIKARLAAPKPLDYVGVAWLGAHSYNSIALSASAFYQARIARPSRARDAFLGYADPVIPDNPDDFSSVRPEDKSAADEELCARYRYSLTLMHPLPESRTEVANVEKAVAGGAGSEHVFGADFTDKAVLHKKDIGQYRVVYFATHGLLDDGNPCLKTSLLTSFGGEGSDALLDLAKITTLHLDADMVVLSACNTGSNAHNRGAAQYVDSARAANPYGRSKLATPKLGNGGGEALGGLVTSFVQAGARNVVVSNWEVDSGTTERLMISLFSHRNISQAGALAEAERVLMNEPKHSHPYYWAPFTVVGDGDRPMPGSAGGAQVASAAGPGSL